MAKKENYEDARDLTQELRVQAGQDGILVLASDLADRWLPYARRAALEGVVASGVALVAYGEAYRALSELCQTNPWDSEYLQQRAEVGRKLLQQLKNSFETRIGYSQAALQRSDYANAMAYLQELEEKWFGYYEREFPELLSFDSEVQEMRNQGQALLAQTQEFEKLHKQIGPQLEKVEELLLSNPLQAEQVLLGIPQAEMAEALQKRWERLNNQVQQRIAEQERSKLRKSILEAGLKLSSVVNAEGAHALYEWMSQIRLEVRLEEQDENLVQFDNQLDKVRQAYNTFIQVESAVEQAEQARSEGRAAEAMSLLDKALGVARNVDLRARLEAKRALVSKDAERQTIQEQSRERGRQAVLEGRYADALHEFERAQQAGAGELDRWIMLADAGRQLEMAQEVGENLDSALVLLDKVINKLEPLREFSDMNKVGMLLEEAHILRDEYRDQQKWQVDIYGTLIDAEQALENGEPKEAGEILSNKWKQIRQENIGGLIKLWQDTDEIKRLRERINISSRLRSAHEKALVLFEQGEFNTAEQDVNAALEHAPERDAYTERLKALLGRIKSTKASEQALEKMEIQGRAGNFENADAFLMDAANLDVPAERLKQEQSWLAGFRLEFASYEARGNNFKRAYKLLREAQQVANPDQYEKTYEDVHKLEISWRASILRPIQEQKKMKQYREAYNELDRLQKQAAWPEFVDELEQEKKKLVDEWAMYELDEIRESLKQVQTIKDRQKLIDKLRMIANRRPISNDEIQKEVENIISQLNILSEQMEEFKIPPEEISKSDQSSEYHAFSEDDQPEDSDSSSLDFDGLMGMSPYSPTDNDR